ncbi:MULTISPECIES: restriction endonuclease subunit S [Gammaproteobacteria]|uniref:restriction endonuclease subunit S n=1 Tax=Gammaproteobacteria TaxID=1236 RepID=UPI00301D3CF5
MNKPKEGLVPELRFPEFSDEAEWKCEQFNKLYGFKPTNSLSRDKLNYQAGSVKNIHYGDVHKRFSTLFDLSKEIVPFVSDPESVGKIKSDSYCKVTDVVFADASEDIHDIGKCIEIVNLDNQKLISGLHTLLARQKEGKLVKGFGGYLFKSDPLRRQIQKEAQGAKVLGISAGRMSAIKVPYPEEEREQQKISECLASIDELIALHSQKLDRLKDDKMGLMQQLFPADGDTKPRLRFPEFQNSSGWVKRKVSSLLKKTSNPVEVKSDEIYREIGIRSHGKGIFHKEPIQGKSLGNKRVFWVEENAFVLNIVFAWELAIANTSVDEIGMIASHRFPMYKAFKNKVDITYIKYFFLTNKGRELLWIASPGGAGRNKTLGKKDFENLELLIPESIEEQKKIANLLSSTDLLIDIEEQKIDELSKHKKGLMQKLFPTMDNVI